MTSPTHKRKKEQRLVELGFLPYNILIVWGMDFPTMYKLIKRKYDLEVTDEDTGGQSKTLQGKTIHLTGNQTIIWLKWPPKLAPWTLAHEAIHAMNMICETAGIKVSTNNDEIICYGVQHIMREVIEPPHPKRV